MSKDDDTRKAKKKKKRRHRHSDRGQLRELMRGYDLQYMVDYASTLDRRFVLHCGPTNSGKTYDALQALKSADSGVYLGPLRLLALEVFDTLNEEMVPCTLLTGEEFEDVPFSRITASTIELCDYQRTYDVAVIDEAQMLADPRRGANWAKAILGVNAEQIHVCLAPEALPIVKRLIKETGSRYEVVRHERLAPLEFAGLMRNISQVEPGDALITFSRKGVLAIAAELEKRGVKASCIYGDLPPASRREEVRKFATGESTVVVATDAIGMGISLPIRRIVFCEAEKFDGVSRRPLKETEVKQIAGRAGRFGKYPVGYVLTMKEPEYIEAAMYARTKPIDKITIPFPAQVLDTRYTIPQLINEWQRLEESTAFSREDMKEPLFLYESLLPVPKDVPKEMLFQLINCPVSTDNNELVSYYCRLAHLLMEGDIDLPQPPFSENQLQSCETKYKAYDIRHQLLRRVGIEDESYKEKERLCSRINEFLRTQKASFVRKCRICGRPLPYDAPFGVCNRCYSRSRFR